MHNHNVYKQAVENYGIAFDYAKDQYWQTVCEQISNGQDNDMWRIVNKVLCGTKASMVQPLV